MSVINNKNLKQGKHIPYFQFNIFSEEENIHHLISTRKGGVSEKKFSELNLSYNVGDDPEKVKHNRKLIADELNIDPVELMIPCQMHTNQIAIVNEKTKNSELQDIDGLITNTRGIAIAVLVADCVPVFLYDRVKNVIAVLHAGWRGTVDMIVARAVNILKDRFNSDPRDIMAGIGPSISPAAYEVGIDVKSKVDECLGNNKGLILEKNGKLFFDLWKANQLQCIESGIPLQQVEIAGLCTYKHNSIFFSARRSEGNTGRFGAVIVIK